MKHLDEGTLQAWLDMPRSGLDPSEVAEIEDHLARCAPCAAALEELGGADDRVHRLLATGLDRDVEAPPFEAIVARAESQRAGGHPGGGLGRGRLQRMAWAASIVLAIGVGWMTNELYRSAPPSPALRAPLAPPSASEADATRQEVPPAEEREEEAVSSEELRQGGRADEVEQIMAPADADVPAAFQAETATPPAAVVVTDDDAAPERRARQENTAEPQITGAAADALAAAAAPDTFDDQVAADRSPSSADGGAAVEDGVLLRGVVRDANGAPLPSAQVYVEGTSVGALTGQDGSYALLVPRDDSDSIRFSVTVARMGYRTETRELGLATGDSSVADFGLEAVPVSLEEVVGGIDVSTLEWRRTGRTAAESELGSRLRTVPGVEIVTIESAVDRDSGAVLVRVTQRLDDDAVLTLIQGPAGVGVQPVAEPGDDPVRSLRIDDLVILGTAPVSEDSLATLLDALR